MSQKKSGCGCLSIVGIALILAAAGTYGSRLVIGKELTPYSGAKVIPDEAVITSHISTNSNSWAKLQQFGTPVAQNLIEEKLKSWQQEITTQNFNYQTDIQPWVGNIMLAIIPKSQEIEEYETLAVIGIKNKFKAWQFFRKIDKKITKNQYQGIDISQVITQDKNSIYWALIGDKLLLSPTKETIEAAIDTVKGDSSFANREGAKEILSQQVNIANTLAKIYLADPEGMTEKQEVKSAVIGVGVDEQGIKIQAIAKLNPDLVEGFQQQLKPVKNKIISQFPDSTILLMNGQGLNKTWEELIKVGQEYPELEASLNQGKQLFKQSTNLDLETDIFAWMDGEYGIGIIQGKDSYGNVAVGGIMIVETSDRPTTETTLTKVNQIAKYHPFIRIKDSNIQGKQVTEWQTPQNKTFFSHGWLQDNSLLFSFITPFNEIINGQPLTQSETFSEITKALPQENLGYIYLDIEKAMSLSQNYPQTIIISPEAKIILSSLRAVGFTASTPGNNSTQIDVIFLPKKTQ